MDTFYYFNEQDTDKLIENIFNLEPIYFEVDELEELQASDSPFTYEEILDLLYEELQRPAEDINHDVVEYYLNILFKDV